MRIEQLRVDGLRNLREVGIEPASRLNLLVGRNGAGKTSILEAIHLLAHGRSFRAGQPDSLVRHGANGFAIFAQLAAPALPRAIGMAREVDTWRFAHDGAAVGTLLDFVRALAVVSIEPECHALITGPSEARRRYLDWLLFHVEPSFMELWRRYLRALRQRNAGLRAGLPERSIAVWEPELASAGESIRAFRGAAVEAIDARLQPLLAAMAPDLPPFSLRFRAGWPASETLGEALAAGRSADRQRGFTQRGPHRADWRLHFEGALDQKQLSRGQAKLAALACLLSQAVLYRDRTSAWPVLLFDDLASELDAERQRAVVRWAEQTEAQVFVTGTSEPVGWRTAETGHAMFHVEQGRITPLV